MCDLAECKGQGEEITFSGLCSHTVHLCCAAESFLRDFAEKSCPVCQQPLDRTDIGRLRQSTTYHILISTNQSKSMALEKRAPDTLVELRQSPRSARLRADLCGRAVGGPLTRPGSTASRA
jgi:hypothetical protein